MCGSVVRLGVMSYLGEMNGFRVPRPLVCNTLGEMNGLGLHVTSVGRIHLSARGPRHMVWKGVRRRLRLVSFRGGHWEAKAPKRHSESLQNSHRLISVRLPFSN